MFSARRALFALVLQFSDLASIVTPKRATVQMKSLNAPGKPKARGRNTSDPSLLASFIAEKAYLNIENGTGKLARGKLILSGSSVNKLTTFTDRPFRISGSMPAALFSKIFADTFNAESGGFPNAVIAGGTPDGPTQVTIVLESASYEWNQVTFSWSSDDDAMVHNLELTSASLFIDGFSCVFWHPELYVEYEVCNYIGKALVAAASAGTGLVCTAVDLSGLGVCAAATAETAETLLPFCEGAVVTICSTLVATFTSTMIHQIEDGTITLDQACKDSGYVDPC